MRFAAVPGYYPSFPVTYENMYRDHTLQTAGFSDPFNPLRREEENRCGYVVGYNGSDDPRYQMNNPAYMREVSRSHSDNIPPVILNKRPIQNQF